MRLFIALAATAALFAATLVMTTTANAGAFGETISGNFSDTAIDTNGDTAAANLFSGATKGRASATYEGILEIQITGPSSSPDCSGGLAGVVVAYSMVRRYPNGDLLYSKLADVNSGSLCFFPELGTAKLGVDAVFNGGTGKFAGASGGYHASYSVTLLLPDPAGGIAHGAFSGTTKGTLS